MGEKIEDGKDFKPIIERAIKTIYGEEVEGIRIHSAKQYPLSKEEKISWHVKVTIKNNKDRYDIRLTVRITDKTVTETDQI